MDNRHDNQPRYTLQQFFPLIIIFTTISAATLIKYVVSGTDLRGAMYDFMGFFFLVFGSFKLINWHGFVEAYRTYDYLAGKSVAYAYAYPLIEVGLGTAYLMRWQPVLINSIAIGIMIAGSLSVLNALRKQKQIMCACLGAVFKLPMTYVTLAEDLLMLLMAIGMLYSELV